MNNELNDVISKLTDCQKDQVLRFSRKVKKSNLILIKEIVIENAPTYYQIKNSKESKLKGEDVFTKYYLTSNLFVNNTLSYHITTKIIQSCKIFLRDKIKYLPPMEKINVEIEVSASKDIDLDGRAFFWRKLMHDILKTPTPKQVENSKKRKNEIITLNAIYDDSTKYGFDMNLDYFNFGENVLTFRIYGRVKNEQKEMDLFFK